MRVLGIGVRFAPMDLLPVAADRYCHDIFCFTVNFGTRKSELGIFIDFQNLHSRE